MSVILAEKSALKMEPINYFHTNTMHPIIWKDYILIPEIRIFPLMKDHIFTPLMEKVIIHLSLLGIILIFPISIVMLL